jgi:replication factor A2
MLLQKQYLGTVTCTIQQIKSAEFNKDQNKYIMDGQAVGTVAVMGEIIEIDESPTFTKFTIEDGTGSILAKKWNESPNANDGDSSAPEVDLGLRKGMWVRIHCSLKEFQGSQQLNVHGFVEEQFQKDFNAITHHYLSAIVESLGKTRGPLSQLKNGGQAVATPAYGQPAEFVAQRASGPAVVADSSSGNLESQLKTIFESNPPTDHGWSVDEIMGQLTTKVARSAVKEAIISMCDDGQLYSTIDDDHFASTM